MGSYSSSSNSNSGSEKSLNKKFYFDMHSKEQVAIIDDHFDNCEKLSVYDTDDVLSADVLSECDSSVVHQPRKSGKSGVSYKTAVEGYASQRWSVKSDDNLVVVDAKIVPIGATGTNSL